MQSLCMGGTARANLAIRSDAVVRFGPFFS